MNKLYVGVDVGNKGALCIMDSNQKILEVFVMPTFQKYMGKGKKVKLRTFTDNIALVRKFSEYEGKGYSIVFGLETIFALRSAYGSMNMGIGYGLLWGALEQFGEVNFFTPAEWQKNMLNEYKSFIVELDTSDLKENSKELPIGLTRHFFGNDILLATSRSRVPHDGIADAIWIADYLRRTDNV